MFVSMLEHICMLYGKDEETSEALFKGIILISIYYHMASQLKFLHGYRIFSSIHTQYFERQITKTVGGE